jgi:preprotein translocase subunit SecE
MSPGAFFYTLKELPERFPAILFMSIQSYIRETQAELRHVTWPTKSQAIAYTVIVILISAVIAAYLGLFDYIFSVALEKFIL